MGKANEAKDDIINAASEMLNAIYKTTEPEPNGGEVETDPPMPTSPPSVSTAPAPPMPTGPPPVSTTAPQAVPPSRGSLVAEIATVTVSGTRTVLNADEGWGKTSMAAFAAPPEANLIVLAPNELGYDTLLREGLVPAISRVQLDSPEKGDGEAPWEMLMDYLDGLVHSEMVYKLITFDAVGGFETLCHHAVCQRDFKGDWGPQGFEGWGQGYKVSLADWDRFLAKLDRIVSRGTDILFLGHIATQTYKNPTGPDYDRLVSDMYHKGRAATHRWADHVLFATYQQLVETKKAGDDKGKGTGQGIRVIHTSHADAYDAKNRCNLPSTMLVGNIPASQMWSHIQSQKGANKNGA